MPLTIPSATNLLTVNLSGVSLLGVSSPQLARGIAIGVALWTPKIIVATVDSGTLGAGKGTPTPIILAPTVLRLNLTTGFSAQGLLGVYSPIMVTGLTNGFVQVYAMAITNTAHSGVGAGAGVATFQPPPATPDFRVGLSSVGLNGIDSTRLAAALALGLETTFRSLVLPQPIVGPASPLPGAGTGFGNIL